MLDGQGWMLEAGFLVPQFNLGMRNPGTGIEIR